MHIGGGGNNHNNNKYGGQRGLEKCDSGFSVFVAQGWELRIPITLRVVGKLTKNLRKMCFLLQIMTFLREVLISCLAV